MQIKNNKYDLVQLLNATSMRKNILDNYRKTVQDPDKELREKDQLCQVCYYGSRIGGAAITCANCGYCNKEMTFGSTAVDVLCPECAHALGVCKQCGADMEYKHRRKLERS